MRVQNVSLNNQPQRSQKSKNQNPAFKANLYGELSTVCTEIKKPMCELAITSSIKAFCDKAIEEGKILKENIGGIFAKCEDDNKITKVGILDKTTELYKKLSGALPDSVQDKNKMTKAIKAIADDQETEKIAFTINEDEVCPTTQILNMFI